MWERSGVIHHIAIFFICIDHHEVELKSFSLKKRVYELWFIVDDRSFEEGQN